MESCVRYRITQQEIHDALKDAKMSFSEEEVNELAENSNFLEVWEGLPSEYTFEKATTIGNLPTLRADGPDIYIWVTPDGRKAIESNPKHLLLALGNRCQGSVDFFYIEPTPNEMSVAGAIAIAKHRNRKDVPEALIHLRQQKQQSEQRKEK